MAERRNAIPVWAWIVGAVLVIASAFVGYRIVQTQQHLAAAQRELEIAKKAAETANAERKQFETKSNDATSAVRSAEIQLAEAQSVLEAARRELENTTQATEKANAQRAETQTKLDETSSENNRCYPSLRRSSLFWKLHNANLRVRSKRLSRRTPSALSGRFQIRTFVPNEAA